MAKTFCLAVYIPLEGTHIKNEITNSGVCSLSLNALAECLDLVSVEF